MAQETKVLSAASLHHWNYERLPLPSALVTLLQVNTLLMWHIVLCQQS